MAIYPKGKKPVSLKSKFPKKVAGVATPARKTSAAKKASAVRIGAAKAVAPAPKLPPSAWPDRQAALCG